MVDDALLLHAVSSLEESESHSPTVTLPKPESASGKPEKPKAPKQLPKEDEVNFP